MTVKWEDFKEPWKNNGLHGAGRKVNLKKIDREEL